MKKLIFVILICLSTSAYSQKNDINPVFRLGRTTLHLDMLDNLTYVDITNNLRLVIDNKRKTLIRNDFDTVKWNKLTRVQIDEDLCFEIGLVFLLPINRKIW